LLILHEPRARRASVRAHLLQDDGAMSSHQVQRHFESSQQRGGPARAAFLQLQGADLDLLALDALAHLNDQPVDLGKFSISITDPGEATAPPVGDVTAEAINEQLVVRLRHSPAFQPT
jgi:hypothetical protein